MDGFDETCYEKPAVYIIPIAECMLKKIKQVFCRPCRTFVIESMISQHCSTTKHAECFFNECFEFSVFTHLTSSICCSYVSPYIAGTSSCTISEFFEKLSKQFCVSNKPFAKGGFSEIYMAVELTTQSNVAIKVFKSHASPANIMSEYNMMKSFEYV